MQNKESEFHEFLLEEYNHIAEAHFKTNETLTRVFQQYFTIVGLPFSVLVVVVSLEPARSVIISGNPVLLAVVALLFIVISVLGLMVLIHISNLRFDALLYARTINALRKHFYDLTETTDLASKNMMRVLPQSPMIPPYQEFPRGFMAPIVFAMSFVNSAYFYLGLICWQFASGMGFSLASTQAAVNLCTGIFFATHIVVYVRLAQAREYQYLRSNIMGIDIDGVLNKQPTQFCRFLEKNAGKKITEAQIVTIPVHDCKNLGISEADEKAVFNDPAYWIEMPVADAAPEALGRLCNSYGLRLHLFTHRPWPITTGLSSIDTRRIETEWVKQSWAFDTEIILSKGIWDRVGYSLSGVWRTLCPYRLRRFRLWFTSETPIDSVTKNWLEMHGLKYHALMIEKGSEDVGDPAMQIYNRFYACRTHPKKYFVEDDLVKAKKLASICDVVFLMDQPYNRAEAEELPKNIVRVSDWKEILIQMRQFC